MCSVCFCSLLPRLTLLLSFLDILHCLPRAVGVPLESALKSALRCINTLEYMHHWHSDVYVCEMDVSMSSCINEAVPVCCSVLQCAAVCVFIYTRVHMYVCEMDVSMSRCINEAVP